MSEYTLTLIQAPDIIELILTAPSLDAKVLTSEVGTEETLSLFSGFRGAPGEQGEQGEPGDAASPQRIDFSSSDTWNVTHNFGRYPVIFTYTVGGVSLMGTITHINTNQTQITFDEPIAGFVIIS